MKPQTWKGLRKSKDQLNNVCLCRAFCSPKNLQNPGCAIAAGLGCRRRERGCHQQRANLTLVWLGDEEGDFRTLCLPRTSPMEGPEERLQPKGQRMKAGVSVLLAWPAYLSGWLSLDPLSNFSSINPTSSVPDLWFRQIHCLSLPPSDLHISRWEGFLSPLSKYSNSYL